MNSAWCCATSTRSGSAWSNEKSPGGHPAGAFASATARLIGAYPGGKVRTTFPDTLRRLATPAEDDQQEAEQVDEVQIERQGPKVGGDRHRFGVPSDLVVAQLGGLGLGRDQAGEDQHADHAQAQEQNAGVQQETVDQKRCS